MAGQEAEIGALGIIILAGVIGRLFLKKTGVSDVFLLLLFGACAGALLQPDVVEGMGALMLPLGAVALLMIIMDEGLRLSFESLRKQLHKALFLGILSFSLAFALSFAISYWLFGLGMLLSLIVAAIFSSVAPELLSGFLFALGASESAKAIGEIEVTITDSLSVMLALVLSGSVARGGIDIDLSALPADIALVLLLSAACGSLLAALWKAFVSQIAEENEHLVAIGLAALLYAGSSLIGANGVVSVFIFSFFLGNTTHQAIEEVRKFQSEITFFLRTFFFVYLGVLLFHSPKPAEVALAALALSLLLALARAFSSRAVGFFDPTARKGRLLETVSSRGLSSAVLSVIVAGELSNSGVRQAIDLPLLALFVIFFTNLITAFFVLKKRKLE
ncbi:TPA: hypothetical protein HA225_04505 [Candidatus Micrarchaeota archaeon]|nr:hypothetical protein [Candidatus Micrarchaeota archaeon]HIH30184.1 hypothetical protein [Candidatus Micrarchaeota archaeon]